MRDIKAKDEELRLENEAKEKINSQLQVIVICDFSVFCFKIPYTFYLNDYYKLCNSIQHIIHILLYKL